MTPLYRPLLELADREALDQTAIDRWFGPPPDDLLERAEWYRLRRMARDVSYMSFEGAGPLFRRS